MLIMEDRGTNGVVEAAVMNRGSGTPPIQNRRTAAIDVLMRALISPSTMEGSENATTHENGNEGNAETAESRAASDAVAAAAVAARSFLDATSSIYVLDADTSNNSATSIIIASDASTSSPGGLGSNIDPNAVAMPRIFGCWNFLHQAMNEIERFEDEQSHLAKSNPQQGGRPLRLLSETRLLAEFAVKVARRSDELDRQKVATCVENFCGSTGKSDAGSSTAMKPAIGKENKAADSSGNEANDTNDSQPDRNPKGRLDVNHKMVGTNNNEADSTNANRGGHDINILLPHLVRSNAEIREIVTGRIAAFSFAGGRPPSAHAMPLATVFSDPQVVETFCRFLAANAVSNGTERLRRFLNDWIIPGATAEISPSSSPLRNTSPDGGKRQRLQHRLPSYSLACVLYHVAAEAEMIPPSSSSDSEADPSVTSGTISPVGTIDVLQRLSLPVMANVLLGPVLADALQRKHMKRQLKQHRQHMQQPDVLGSSEEDDMDDRTIAMGLRAILKWCTTTGLSLAQTKHIGSKVQLNLSRILGEALLTDSPEVMSALADLIEDVVEQHVVPQPKTSQPKQNHCLISESRMTQTRYLMQVPDEASFRANVSEEQLHMIETKELSDLLSELSGDVEGQRFRFPSFGKEATKDKGDPSKKPLHGEVLLDENTHSLGLSLARIAAALCVGYSKVTETDAVADGTTGKPKIPGAGMLELLTKCASHPSVAICGTVLPVITPVLKTQVGLATQWLPTLQRRAIIPHHPNNTAILSSSNNRGENSDETYIPLLAASDVCSVEFEEFIEQFRSTVLADALNACYTIHSEYYLASCTAAIEEFCVGDVATEQTSFHLEAALFCLAAVSDQVLISALNDPTSTGATSPTPASKLSSAVSSYLLRCTAALAKKPKSLNNPLTMVQACRFMRKYANWFGSNQHPGILDISADLTLHILVQCASDFPDTPLSETIQKETGVAPYSEATKTLRCLLCNNANHFLSNKAIAALGAGWEATFAACNRGGKLLTLEDRKDTCAGICHVLAALPRDQQQTSLMALALASIACLEAMVERADSVESTGGKDTLSPILDRAADEIVILVTAARAFTDALSAITSGTRSSRTSFTEPSLTVLRRAWPTISIVASKYSFHDNILEALQFLFLECMPTNYKSDTSIKFLQNMCELATKVINNETARERNNRSFSPALYFVDGFLKTHGRTFEKILLTKQSSGNQPPESATSSHTEQDETAFQCIDALAQETIKVLTGNNLLGNAWMSDEVQGNGQSAFQIHCKPQPQKRGNSCNSGLAPLFTLLSTCMEHCPAFLLHILASGGSEGSEGDFGDDAHAPDLLMIQKALESSVSSIIDVEAETSIGAIAFLDSIVSLASTNSTNNTAASNESLAARRLAREYNLAFQTKMLSALFRGICGTLQPVVVSKACRLMFETLSKSSLSEEEFKVIVLRGLSQEHFFLGKRARGVIYECCLLILKRSDSAQRDQEFENMMMDVWRLHHFENVDTIDRSDVVHSFCIRHRKILPTP